jgi:hypothetical protein
MPEAGPQTEAKAPAHPPGDRLPKSSVCTETRPGQPNDALQYRERARWCAKASCAALTRATTAGNNPNRRPPYQRGARNSDALPRSGEAAPGPT